MRLPVSAVVLGLIFTGCTSRVDDAETGKRTLAGMPASQALPNPRARTTRPSIASMPDDGALLRYDAVRRIEPRGAYTYYPVSLSEAHAYRALASGELVIATPDRQPLRLRATRHEEYPDGNWTLVARDTEGSDALLTFGQDAVFGTITRRDGSLLRLVTRHRQVYLVAADRAELAKMENPGATRRTDVLLPPPQAAAAAASSAPSATSAQVQASAVAMGANDIDVLMGYSNGLVARIGSESGAATRMQNLVAIANEAYQNSGITLRLSLVRSMLVNYPDNTTNQDALQKMTGSTGSGSIPVDPAFAALRTAREETGADLVSFVRQFREPENDGCGIAWLLGGGQSAITQGSATFAYSVASDGSDVRESDGRTYFCREETFAHETGHNMGQAHNQEDSTSAGAHAYSYGYREASTSGFYTVMAYRITDSSQFSIRYFANPGVSFDGRPTGVANQSDNARSMNQTMPIVATFRQATSPPTPGRRARQDIDGDGKSELIWQFNSQIAYWVVNGGSTMGSVYAGALSDPGYRLVATGDFDGNGRGDLIFDVQKPWARYLTRWINTGQGFASYSQEYPNGGWVPVGAVDLDGDGKSELIWQFGSQIAYWVVNGASTVSSVYAGALSDPGYRLVATGDFDGNGRGDLIFDVQKPWARYLTRWINTGQGFASYSQEYPNGGWIPVGGGDLDGDGKSELIWQFGSQIAYWVVNGGSTVSSVYAGSLGDPGYRLVGTGDYDGNGRGDLIFDVQKPWARYLTRWINTGQGFTSYSQEYANGGWVPPQQGL